VATAQRHSGRALTHLAATEENVRKKNILVNSRVKELFNPMFKESQGTYQLQVHRGEERLIAAEGAKHTRAGSQTRTQHGAASGFDD
jgi:hypothetical protein